jgi:uncharacterized membrane protein
MFWMLSFIPDSLLLYIVNAILIAGAIGTFFTFFILHRVVRWFPAIAPYHLILQVISIVLLVSGVYFKGGYDTEASWREKLRVAEEKAQLAEQQAKDANAKIQTKIVEKIKVVKENTIVYRDRIKEVEKLIDQECKVAPEAVDIHNAAAKNKKLGEGK